MPYVVTENCIRCKCMNRVNTWPVDCFYEGENVLVIHPHGCIDCGIYEAECPAAVIVPTGNPKAADWIALDARDAAHWPNISIAKRPSSDPRELNGRANKRRDYFSENPSGNDA